MDCTEVREVLVSQALGVLDSVDADEFDAHTASCARCAALAGAGDKALAILRDWRAVTDAPLDEAEIEAVVSGLAAIESARSERVSARRSSREAAAPPKRNPVFVIAGVLILVGAALTAYFLLIDGPADAESDPLYEIAPLITNGERARDAACVMDVMLLHTISFATPSNAQIAAISWARAIARREGFAARCAFVRAALGAEAGSVEGDGPPGPIPLRFLGDLELAGLHTAAEAECKRVIAATKSDTLRRRTKLHLAAALLGQGKLDSATTILDEIAPPPSPPTAPSEDGAEPAPDAAAPRDFIAQLADILRARAMDAADARKTLAEYKGSRRVGADYRGGKLAIKALELDRAAELLEGDGVDTAPLIRGWLRLLRGEVDAAKADFIPVTKDGARYHRGLANLGLAECAFRQGRFRTARYYLRNAKTVAVDEYHLQFFFAIQLRRVTHAIVDFGKPSFVASDLELVPAEGAMRGLVDSVLVTRMKPLADARDAVTEDWPKRVTDFTRVLGPPPAGTVSPTKAMPKIDFDTETADLDPATDETDVSVAEGLKGQGVRVSSFGTSAAARLVFDEPIPEVETWIAFAVKLESPGMFTVWVKDADDNKLFRWRTVSIPAGVWRRVALPLGAFEPETPTGGDESLLMKRVYSIAFSIATGAGEQASFILDDILIHHGLVPDDTDDPPETAER